MLRIGLTGNIASGKSTVAREFTRLGATVVDADVLAREAVEPGTAALATLVETFGPDVLTTDGTLDRAALRRLVFGDPAALARLNAIVHPAVAALREQRAEQARRDGVTVFVDEIPLLFEVGLGGEFDAIVFVDAAPAERLRRLREHRGLSEREAHAMMSAQGDPVAKRARATWILDNDGSRDALLASVAEVWQDIQARLGP